MDTKRKSSSTILITILAVLPSLAVLPAEAAIKCWTNKDGVRECGNVVPPEFAQQGHDEVSSGGVTRESTRRAKSLEELKAEHAEAKRKAAAEMLHRAVHQHAGPQDRGAAVAGVFPVGMPTSIGRNCHNDVKLLARPNPANICRYIYNSVSF